MPTEALEEWRYGRVDELDLERFPPFRPAARTTPSSLSGLAVTLLGDLGAPAAVAGSLDGVVGHIELSEATIGAGVAISSVHDQSIEPRDFGSVVADRADAFTLCADAFGPDALICTIPAGVELTEPIVILHEISAQAAGSMVFPRTLIRLGEGARASVVELLYGGEEPVLVVPIAELILEADARLVHQGIQQLGRKAWHLGYEASRVGRSAHLTSFVSALGGDYARLSLESNLADVEAVSELLAVYLADGSSVQDIRTFQVHAAPRTTSELVFKGAAADFARSVYTGLIHIEKGARRSNASQSNRNLVLSEGAHADSVPNLDIEENDVHCSHASAVGPIDPEARYYLEARGIPPVVADRLIALGFFDDLLSRSPVPGCVTFLRRVLTERLERQFADPSPGGESE